MAYTSLTAYDMVRCQRASWAVARVTPRSVDKVVAKTESLAAAAAARRLQADKEATERALAEGFTFAPPVPAGPLPTSLTRRFHAKPRTQECLELLEQALREVEGARGLTLEEGCSLISGKLGHKLKPESLRSLIRRGGDCHFLAIDKNVIRLPGNLVLKIIAERRAADRVAALDRMGAADEAAGVYDQVILPAG